MNGYLNIDKPSGVTSFDVVRAVRKLAGISAVGHSGTLDPLATGVLPVFLGRSTKAIDLLPNQDKEYLAVFRCGISTDTQDITGVVTQTYNTKSDFETLQSAASSFVGRSKQTPPAYSAVKVGGRKLYELARAGEQIPEIPQRSIFVSACDVVGCREDEYILRVACSKGTYVRTIIDTIGKMTGFGAAMTELRRTMACGLSVEESIPLAQLQTAPVGVFLRPVEELFQSLQKVEITPKQAVRLRNGGELDLNRVDLPWTQGRAAVYVSGSFLGVGDILMEAGVLKPVKILADAEIIG